MALILHIADLHLVAAESSAPIDDHKVGLVPKRARATHHKTLLLTMSRLGETLAKNGQTLDAIIVTGDISNKNNEGGYRAFLALLGALGAAKPGPERIVVVPGNHDVASGLPPGDPSRYAAFVEFIRNSGFVTPCLDGLDTAATCATNVKSHLFDFDNVQIIPIDSSAYSQVKLDLGLTDAFWARLEADFSGTPDLDKLKRLQIVDAARVSDTQLEALHQVLSGGLNGRRPLRIAAIHHHLLPVSLKEEVKPFESLTNLALVRRFLRNQEVSIVLHGHKHTEFTYVDQIPGHGIDAGQSSSVRVISGAAASGADLDRSDVFRLLDIDADAGIVKVQRIPIAIPGGTFSIGHPQPLHFTRPGGPTITETAGTLVINGSTIDLVYNQLVAKLANRSGEADHVVCRIERSPELEDIAKLYPGFVKEKGQRESDVAKLRLEQFRDLVSWWQFPNAPLSPWEQPGFTHGNRIQRFNGHLNQLKEAVSALTQDRGTTRGVVVLLSPEADKIAQQSVPFPSFCLLQFKISPSTGGPLTLECTAYFRKQEMRFWWLVNLAELAQLQREVCDSLRSVRDHNELRSIRPGPITTIAARAKADRTPPKVQVPRIDRYYSLSRERLFGMVNALLWKQMPGREHYAHDWMQLFTELVPPETSDPDGLAVAHEGLKYIRSELDKHLKAKRFQSDQELQDLRGVLNELLAMNSDFALLQQEEKATPDKHAGWRSAIIPLLNRVVKLTHGRISAVSSPSSPRRTGAKKSRMSSRSRGTK